MIQEIDFFDGTVGGGRLTSDRTRGGLKEDPEFLISSPLDRRLAKLLTLHREVRIKFRNHDLASLDDATKEALLEDINRILKIAKLKND